MDLELVEEEKADLQRSLVGSSSPPTDSGISETIQSVPMKNEAPSIPFDEATSDVASPPEKAPKKSLRFKLTITFLCVVSLVASIDAVIVAACLAAIAEDLGGDSVKTFWIGTSFLLAQTVTVPIYGTLSDIFGRKWLMMNAIGLFLLGSILCATAQSMNWLIGARVVQGLGAGGTLNLVSVIISDITEMRERGLYLSLGGLSWAIGTNVAIPLGGAIAGNTTWRWVFWINLPLGIVPLVGLYFTLNLKKDTSSFKLKLARVDYLGMGVFTAATCAFLVGITTGGTLHPWSSASVLAPLIIGIALYVVFVIVEWKIPKEPMIPLRVFNDRTAATAGFWTAFGHGVVLWCYTYYMIVFFLGALQHGRFRSALETLPGTAYTAPAAICAGLLAKRFLRFRPQIWSGWALVVIGMGLSTLMHPDSNGGILYGLRVFSSVGGGLLFPTPVFAAQVNQKNQDVGIATSLIAFFRSLGQAFGVAIGGVIFQNQWDIEVGKWISRGVIPKKFALNSNTAEVAYGVIRSFPDSVQGAYSWVYSDSLKMVWIIMTSISAASFLIVLWSRNESLDKGHSSTQTFEEKIKKSEKSEEGV